MGSVERLARLYLRVLVSGCLDGLLTVFRCILKILRGRLTCVYRKFDST